MTAAEVLARVDAAFPHALGEPFAMRELERAENLVRAEVLGLPPLEEALGAEDSLCASGPHEGLYEHFVAAMLAEACGESARYNNEMALYAALSDAFARACRRGNRPPRGAEVRYG